MVIRHFKLILPLVVALSQVSWAQDGPQFKDKKAQAEAETISKALGKRYNYFESANFTWCTASSPGKSKGIVDAAEKAYSIYAKHAGLSSWRQLWGSQKAMVVLCANKRQYKKYVNWYSETYNVWDKAHFRKQFNSVNWFIVSDQRRVAVTHFKPNDEKAVAMVVAHLVGHLVTHRTNFNNNFVPPWLEESVALYLESKVTGKIFCGCYSNPYGLTSQRRDFAKGYPTQKFKAKVKGNIAKSRLKTVSALFRPRLGELTIDDLQKGYAAVSWMFSQPKGLAKFIRKTKRSWPAEVSWNYLDGHGKAQEKAFKAVFGLSLDEVEAAIKAYAASKL